MRANQPIGIGVVGTGGWARGFWQDGQESPDVKLVACWNRTRERAEKFAEKYGGEVAPSLEALLAHPQVEAVANFASNNYHSEPTKLAAAAGKHVFVDKPIANTFAESVEMIEGCDRAGVTLMVGHSTRYHGANRTIKQYLEAGTLGTLAMVEGNVSHSGGTRLSEDAWRWHWEEAPGGPLMQLSIHVYDTLHYFFGPTRRVTALSKRDLLPSEIEDVFLTLLEFESGLLAYVGTNYVAPPIHFIRVYGQQGNLYSEGGKLIHMKPVSDWSAEPLEVEVPKSNAHAAELSEFARAIRTGTRPETDGRGGLLALGVVWAAIRSAEQNRPVEVREAMGDAARLLD
jgi:predicted dehydrogenase